MRGRSLIGRVLVTVGMVFFANACGETADDTRTSRQSLHGQHAHPGSHHGQARGKAKGNAHGHRHKGKDKHRHKGREFECQPGSTVCDISWEAFSEALAGRDFARADQVAVDAAVELSAKANDVTVTSSKNAIGSATATSWTTSRCLCTGCTRAIATANPTTSSG